MQIPTHHLIQMASEVPPSAQAVINKCSVCDRGADARFYCKNCDQELCRECKKMHSRLKGIQNHKIIGIAVDIDTASSKSGLGTSKTPILCSFHPRDYIQMFCLTCEVAVCHSCIAEKTHKHHDMEKLENVTNKYRKELSVYIAETKQEILELQTTVQTVQNHITDYTKFSLEAIDGINMQREQLKSQVDKMAYDLIDKVRKRRNQDLHDMKHQIGVMLGTIAHNKELLFSYEETMRSTNDHTLINLTTDIRNSKKKSIAPSIHYIKPPKFLSDDTLVFGKLQDKSEKYGSPPEGTLVNIIPEEVADIKSDVISVSINAFSDRQAWCGSGIGYGNSIALINTNGKVEKLNLDFKFYDLASTLIGELLITEFDGYHVRKYSLEGEVKSIANMSPYKTRGLCMTSDQNILVCLYRGQEENKVVRMGTNGEIKQTIHQDTSKKAIFSDPSLVQENINGDVCVVNGLLPCTIVVVNKTGAVRFRYPDTDTSGSLKSCFGIACDNLGHILISDSGNNQIHMISRNGSLLRYILTAQHGIRGLLGISVDDKGQLWVCNENGNKIKIFKYTF